MKTKHSIKSLISGMLAVVMTIGAIPSMSVFAAQVNEYIDPADVWITSNGRTNELDFNATITQETLWCPVCNKDTIMLTYRTPEYTKSGTTALNRGVAYSDGTMTDGVTKGNIDDGRPGIDATYTTYHWTKSICQVCGTINSADGFDSYCFSRNVYSLNSCDHDFFLDFDNTTYEPYNDTYHTTVLKKGQYCQFCKGTKARATEKREAHNFIEVIDAQLGNNRFYVSERCDDCGYETNEYITAKSVVSSYYGTVDGSPHTVSVSDLSEGDVHTSIRYGTSANSCTLTSAPNYTEAGYYPVYYEIDYKYDGKSMTENGVSYVWLLEDENDTTATVSQTSLAAEVPIESAPCNATVESIAITEQLISDELTAVQNGEGYQPAWARANRKIFDAVIAKQTNGYGYSDLANIARNALIQYRDMYLRPDYYKAQDAVIYSLIADLIAEVQSGKDYIEALDEAYTRIYQSIDPSYKLNCEIGIDRIYLDIPAADVVRFSRARKYLLEAIPQTE